MLLNQFRKERDSQRPKKVTQKSRTGPLTSNQFQIGLCVYQCFRVQIDYIHKINNIFLLFFGASEDWMGHFEILMFEDGRYVIKFFMYLTRRTKSLTRTHSHIEH